MHQLKPSIRSSLPIKFVSNITNVFGDEGRAWLDKLDDLVDTCRKQWHLTEITPVDTLSFNLACFARSPHYGDIVLKIGVPHPELFTEMKSVQLYGNHVMCTCFEVDEPLGAMLLERISPGRDLRDVHDLKLRTRIAARLMRQMHQSVKEELQNADPLNRAAFPPISKWFNDAFVRARKERKVGEEMLRFIHQAEKWFAQLTENNRKLRESDTLLHADLHHYNILQDQEGFRAIDPKGVYGPKSMEPAPYILNQLEFNRNGHCITIDEMIRIFHEETGESMECIALATFVFSVLSVTWEYEQEQLPPAEELEELHRQIRTCYEYASRIAL